MQALDVALMQQGFNPLKLSGLQLWLDSCVTNSLTVDSSARVSAWADLSGNGRNATQGTTGYMPLLSRGDNRENLHTHSENVLQWTNKNNATLLSATEFKEDGASGTHYAGMSGYTRTPIGATYVSVSVKRGVGNRHAIVWWDWPTAAKNTYAYINLDIGAITSSGGTLAWTSGPTISADPLDGTYWQVSGVVNTSAPGVGGVTIYMLLDTTTVNYVGDNTSTLKATRAVIRSTAADSTYLATTTAPQYRGVNGRPAIVFDGVDDYLSCDALAAAFTGEDKPITVIIAGQELHTSNSGYALSFGNSASATPFLSWYHKLVTIMRVVFENRDDAGTGNKDTSAVADNMSSPCVISWVSTGAAMTTYKNGNRSGAASMDINVGTLTLNRATIGALGRNTYSGYYSGPLTAIVVVNRALTDSERAKVEKWLMRRVGV